MDASFRHLRRSRCGDKDAEPARIPACELLLACHAGRSDESNRATACEYPVGFLTSFRMTRSWPGDYLLPVMGKNTSSDWGWGAPRPHQLVA